MVRLASGGVTPLGFRRDIKLFLACLVGFLIVIIVSLLLYLQRFANVADEALFQQREVVADAAVRRLEELGSNPSSALIEDRLVYLRSLYNIDYAAVRLANGTTLSSGLRSDDPALSATRRTQVGVLTVAVRRPEGLPGRAQLLFFSGIVLAATAGGTILFLLFLPRIVRPLEQLLEEARGVADRDEHQDEPTFLIETFRSTIDTMKQQEAELKRLSAIDRARADELEAVTATLTRSIRAGFVAIAASGTVIDVNAEGRRLLGISSDQPLAGRTIAEVLGDADFAAVLQAAVDARQELSRTETSASNGEGRTPIELTAVPLLSREGKYLGMIAIFDDLSPIRALESQLREQQRLADLGEVSAGIAHEFRNSLATILGYLKLLKRATADDSLTGHVRHAEREAQLLSRAVESLLTFARPLQVERRVEVNLRDVIQRATENLAGMADVRLDLQPCPIHGDESLLARAIENIVRNAVESIQQKGSGKVSVTLRAEPQPTMIVEDEGVGLNQADAERLLLPFQSDRPGGFGMGLALAKRIVVAHGGTIALTGSRGIGAAVTVTLPPMRSELDVAVSRALHLVAPPTEKKQR